MANYLMLTRVEPRLNDFSITWNLGRRCNFDCSYCPARLHDKTSAHKNLQRLKSIWQGIHDKTKHLEKRYKISFTGGEPTMNPDFLPFLIWLREEFSDDISNMGYNSNASAPTSYYLQSLEYVDWITFSSHWEFMNWTKFQKNVIAAHIRSVKSRKHVFVNIMDEPDGRVATVRDFCVNHRIPYSLNKLWTEQ
jgi:organic radical activating enzyme